MRSDCVHLNFEGVQYLLPIIQESKADSEKRSSKSAHFRNQKKHKKFIDRLDRRVSIISGLKFSLEEPTQVANYGIGGHFNPHTDVIEYESNRRIATWLGYLSDRVQRTSTISIQILGDKFSQTCPDQDMVH